MIKTFIVPEGDLAFQQGAEVNALLPDEGESASVAAIAAAAGASSPNPNYLSLAQIKKGSTGVNVAFAQKQLKLYTPSEAASVIVDGNFGATTDTAVKAFQKKCGLSQDGIVGSDIWSRLGPNVWHSMPAYFNKSQSIMEVQRLLKIAGRYTGSIDGNFGLNTENAIRLYQQIYGLSVDGIWGKQCWGIVEQGWI